ncbi:MAG: riboflavin synthase [Bauldia sp.]
MFTGIVTAIGDVVSVDRHPELTRLVIASTVAETPPAIGASVAVSGVCLTVVAVKANGRLEMTFEAGPETLALTTVGTWDSGSRVNLERSLRVGDELGGHMVSGHVDGLAEIIARDEHPETVAFRFAAPPALARFIATKGSVCLDGTSLTVNRVEENSFDCHLIPHTLAVTTWSERRVGDKVNLEVDLIARYAERLFAAGR